MSLSQTFVSDDILSRGIVGDWIQDLLPAQEAIAERFDSRQNGAEATQVDAPCGRPIRQQVEFVTLDRDLQTFEKDRLKLSPLTQ